MDMHSYYMEDSEDVDGFMSDDKCDSDELEMQVGWEKVEVNSKFWLTPVYTTTIYWLVSSI